MRTERSPESLVPPSSPASCCEKVGGTLVPCGVLTGKAACPLLLLLRPDTLASHRLGARLWDQGPYQSPEMFMVRAGLQSF